MYERLVKVKEDKAFNLENSPFNGWPANSLITYVMCVAADMKHWKVHRFIKDPTEIE